MCPKKYTIEHNGNATYEKVKVEISAFGTTGHVREHHVILHTMASGELFEVQLLSILNAYRSIKVEELPLTSHPVFIRFFLSDSANQSDILFRHLSKENFGCAISVVEQPPLDGSKIAMWVYLQTDVEIKKSPDGLYSVSHGNYTHFWTGTECFNTLDSESQTHRLLEYYVEQLESEGCNLADNCIRTWFFVQNVDVNYSGVVKARNDVFDHQQLTAQTHFISSTGINGRNADPNVLVQMDTYAVKGISQEQVKFLYAPTHLNPTYEYGVSFERGTYVDYADRRQVFISGTASINNKGEVMHVGDIKNQVKRMIENVEVLLAEAECNLDNLEQVIIYLRDVTDYKVVESIFEARLPHTPKIIVHAPVCRPGWLIEMECMAIRRINQPQYSEF